MQEKANFRNRKLRLRICLIKPNSTKIRECRRRPQKGEKSMETTKKRLLTGNKAMAEAIALEMENNKDVFVLGEEIGRAHV